MKEKITKRQVMNEFMCIRVPYCALDNLLAYESPVYYTAGVYGWNADVYVIDGVAIVTGYRPFGDVKVDYPIIEKYERKAIEILLKRCYFDYKRTELDTLIHDFILECKGIRV